jgi:ATP-dependent Clp protease ATP-binding subunit ClpA
MMSDAVDPELLQLSSQVQQVLSWAADEAQQGNYAVIGTHHILLAILRAVDKPQRDILDRFGVQEKQVRRIIDTDLKIQPVEEGIINDARFRTRISVGIGQAQIIEPALHQAMLSKRQTVLGTNSKRAIEQAVGLAYIGKCKEVRIDHLLLALLQNPSCSAVSILEAMAVDIKQLADGVSSHHG